MQSGGERKQEWAVHHTPAEAYEESCSSSLIRPHRSVALNFDGVVVAARDLALFLGHPQYIEHNVVLRYIHIIVASLVKFSPMCSTTLHLTMD